ncbi:hypothetical protein PG985_006457 [Apiospora marii]|uniref:uncharacterized protein n=1 Tax=Apiospora marii TaxID=335849 RepID=UPI0031301072
MSRPYPTPLQQDQSIFEHDQYHPQQTAYNQQQQQQQSHYQAYHPSFQAVEYQQQSSQQEEPEAPPTPWPTFPLPALQMRRDSSRTLAPTMAPAALDSGTELATRSFSLPMARDVATRGEFGPLVTRGSESGRVPPAVAMMVVMNPSGDEGALQTYSGSSLDGYNYGHNSTDSRTSLSKSLLAPPVASREGGADAAKRHRAERRRFRIMASLGTITAIATVVLAVFTALNFYSNLKA